jgi:hypothetical protein
MSKITYFRDIQIGDDLDLDPWTDMIMRREFALQLIVRLCECRADHREILDTALFGLGEEAPSSPN